MKFDSKCVYLFNVYTEIHLVSVWLLSVVPLTFARIETHSVTIANALTQKITRHTLIVLGVDEMVMGHNLP